MPAADTAAALADASNAEIQRELVTRALARHGREIDRLQLQLSTMRAKQSRRLEELARLETTIAASLKI